jgi:polyisoprenoid-binding protein YceI
MGTPAQADAGALLDGGTVAGRWVLDPGSRAEFHVKHFWRAVTVHGSFGQITGEGSVGPVEFTAHVLDASAGAVVVRADLVVDRTRFAMSGARWAWHPPWRTAP